jgi:hypothetical protein
VENVAGLRPVNWTSLDDRQVNGLDPVFIASLGCVWDVRTVVWQHSSDMAASCGFGY